ncbi:MAG: tetratricopeptide repeat protein [Nitrospirota bacterium]
MYARYLSKKDPEKTKKYFDKAIGLDAKNIVAYTSDAVFYLSQKEFAKARMCCEKANAIKANSVNNVLLFAIYDSLGETALAAELMKKIVKYHNGNPIAAYGEISHLYFTFTMREKAEYYCKEALKLSPNEEEPHCILGIIYYSQGQLHEAKNEYTKAIELSNNKKYIKFSRKMINDIDKKNLRS